jgi:hypothetical protein
MLQGPERIVQHGPVPALQVDRGKFAPSRSSKRTAARRGILPETRCGAGPAAATASTRAVTGRRNQRAARDTCIRAPYGRATSRDRKANSRNECATVFGSAGAIFASRLRASGPPGLRASGPPGLRASGPPGLRASGTPGLRDSGTQSDQKLVLGENSVPWRKSTRVGSRGGATLSRTETPSPHHGSLIQPA